MKSPATAPAKPRRKSAGASSTVVVSDAARDGCILIPGPDGAGVLTFFRPEIANQVCDSGLSSPRIVVPLHPYIEAHAVRVAEDALLAHGMVRRSSEQLGFARIEVFTKP